MATNSNRDQSELINEDNSFEVETQGENGARDDQFSVDARISELDTKFKDSDCDNHHDFTPRRLTFFSLNLNV